MSECVVRMKKPGTCRECFDTHSCFGTGEWHADGTIWCGLAKGYIGDERTKCPVIELPEGHGHENGYAAGYEAARKEIEDVHRWHRVRDELPEVDKRVIVFGNGWTQIMSIRDEGEKLCEKYWEDEYGIWERVVADSYWMYLPEPPKEVQK